MIEVKVEKQQCFCVACQEYQEEELVYDKIRCNNVLHGLLTLGTGIWLVVWLYKRKEARDETDHNRRLALLASQCKECGGSLTLPDGMAMDFPELTKDIS